MKKITVWLMIFVFMISSNLLQGCATTSNTPFTKKDTSTISPLKVAQYETPQIDDTTLGRAIIGATLGAVLLAGVGAGLGVVLAAHKMDKETPVPDFGNLVMTKFVEHAGKNIPNWPTMTFEKQPIGKDYSYKSGAILVFKVNVLAIHPNQGFVSNVVVSMEDSEKNVLWKKGFIYTSKALGREKSQDEYKARHSRNSFLKTCYIERSYPSKREDVFCLLI
ncbi:MAG: hypothetical protein AABZ32_10510 [Bacteroidota bacterium]